MIKLNDFFYIDWKYYKVNKIIKNNEIILRLDFQFFENIPSCKKINIITTLSNF